MGGAPSLVWFRSDLRLADNPALTAALACGGPIVPLFIWAPEEEGRWAPGAASRWWLHQSLASLDVSLRQRGSRLVIRVGSSVAVLRKLKRETGAARVFWNRRYEPAICARDAVVQSALRADGVQVETFNATLLLEPGTVRTVQGTPFQVFAPFWRACRGRISSRRAGEAPPTLTAPRRWPQSLLLSALELEPKIDWTAGLRAAWRPGEQGAAAALKRFVNEGLVSYAAARDRPDVVGTSRLSPHLHFGEIGPRQVWRAIEEHAGGNPAAGMFAAAEACCRQIVWREFAYHLLFHFPATSDKPLRPAFAAFPWRRDSQVLRAWQRGRTGYPIIDAGMRELWRTGWMHNRVRMLVASFLVKDLLLRWQHGARWFWDTLVDADLANNTLGWQWVAGCGSDAAPYFRIFNPVLQGQRFDPDGDYVRRWVPELGRLPSAWIHRPWMAPPHVLEEAGVEIGRTYPAPVVDHDGARRRALAALAAMKTRIATKPGRVG